MTRLVMLKILARRNPLQNNSNIHNKINRQFVTCFKRILSPSKSLIPLYGTYISPYPIGEIVVLNTYSKICNYLIINTLTFSVSLDTLSTIYLVTRY